MNIMKQDSIMDTRLLFFDFFIDPKKKNVLLFTKNIHKSFNDLDRKYELFVKETLEGSYLEDLLKEYHTVGVISSTWRNIYKTINNLNIDSCSIKSYLILPSSKNPKWLVPYYNNK